MNLPEERWWNTLIPLQYTLLRKALLRGKRGLVSSRNSVTCLFPVGCGKVLNGQPTIAKTLVLAMSGREEDTPTGGLYIPKLRTHTIPVVSAIIRSFVNVERLSIDARWVTPDDEYEMVCIVIGTFKNKLKDIHIAHINNNHIPSLKILLKDYDGKSLVTLEFIEDFYDTTPHPKVTMM